MEREVQILRVQAALLAFQVDLAQLQLAVLIHRRNARRRRRRFWCRMWHNDTQRKKHGLYHRLMSELRIEDIEAFTNLLRMPPEMFDELLDRVGPRLTKRISNCRSPVEAGMKLAITLNHLACGHSYKSMRFSWRVAHNTISKIIPEVCQAIFDEYSEDVMKLPASPEEWQHIADGFYKRWQMPNTIGALDGKHVSCRCPPGSGSLYFNYKRYYSVVLMALVDANYKFIWADIGGRGASSDAQLWNLSDLKTGLDDENNPLNIPPPRPLPKDNQPVPYFIIADDAFALRPSLMKPYSHKQMSDEERVFNYRLSRARRVVENAFGILANRFRVLMTTMCHQPQTIRLIVSTCVILHNIMRTRYPGLQNRELDRETEDGDLVPGEWRNERQMGDCLVALGHNRDNRMGKMQRNLLKHWMNSPVGRVPWQERACNLPVPDDA